MVERLSELNKIVQKENYKTKGNWYVRTILRGAALPVTWALLHFNISANQVTLVAIFIGALGVAFFACPSPLSFLIGALLLQLWYLLDHVDGQLARYYKTAGLTGRFYDFIMHHFIHGIFPFGLACYLATVSESSFYLIWGYVASVALFLFNLIHDAKYKTYFELFDQAKSIELINDTPNLALDQAKPTNPTPLKRMYMFLHKSVEMHVMMNVVTFFAVLNLFLKLNWIRGPFFIYYGLVIPFLCVSKLTYLIKTKKIDSEFYRRYKID